MSQSEDKTHRIDPPPAAASADTGPVLARLASRYEILGELGQGGMGVVYRARDRETAEILALKILRPEIAMDPAMAERFKNELRLARRITHRNVCRIYDFNRIDHVAYITMEYVEGESLRARLNRIGGMSLEDSLAIAGQICDGLGEAHAQGIVHRDLKPENVMLAGDGVVKIMDFGIARRLDATAATATQTLAGTPAYMAPEQVHGRPVDQRADLYAVGLILYECLTGRRAFAGSTPVSIALKQAQEQPVSPRKLAPSIPRYFEVAVLRCLEKDPARRFASAAELHAALRSEPQVGKRPGRRSGLIVAIVVGLALGAILTHKSAKRRPIVSGPRPVAHQQTEMSRAANAAGGKTEPPPAWTAPGKEPSARRGIALPSSARHRIPERVMRLIRAAERGDPAAQERIGRFFLNGPEQLRDDRKAFRWFLRAAGQGYSEAQNDLGKMYELGRGTPRSLVEAYGWYSLVARSDGEARTNLDRLRRRMTASEVTRAERRARELSDQAGQ